MKLRLTQLCALVLLVAAAVLLAILAAADAPGDDPLAPWLTACPAGVCPTPPGLITLRPANASVAATVQAIYPKEASAATASAAE